jgi:hypothetical protein
MTRQTNDELRAILLAGVVALALVVNAVALTGSVAAQEPQLNATDGAGGSSSFLFRDGEAQLPEGEESGEDKLTLKTDDGHLPDTFQVILTLEQDSEVEFNTSQNNSNVSAVVFGPGGTPEEPDNATVTGLEKKKVEVFVEYDGRTSSFFGGTTDTNASGVNVSSLLFDTGSVENATLTYEIPSLDKTESYTLDVDTLPTSIEATDANNDFTSSITAGAGAQPLSNDPARLLAGDTTQFPSDFVVTVNLTDDGVYFSDAEPNPTATSGDAEVVRQTNKTIKVGVSNFTGDSGQSEVLSLDGAEFNATSTAGSTNLTWRTLGKTSNYSIDPERLDFDVITGDTEFPRAADQRPDDDRQGGNEVSIRVNGNGKDSTTAFAESNTEMSIVIPEENRENLSFDQSANVGGDVADGSEDGITGTTSAIDDVSIQDNRIDFTLPRAIDNDDRLNVTGIRFNSTAHDGRTTSVGPNVTGGLVAEYRPPNRLDTVNVSSNNTADTVSPIGALAPSATHTGPSGLEENATNQSTGITLNLTDTAGGQMATGEDIVITLEGDSNITFNESQTITVERSGLSQEFYVRENDITVTNYTITIPVGLFPTSQEGDWLNISTESGGLLFDTANVSQVQDASLAVNTTAGDDKRVIQTTSTIVSGCSTIEQAVDENNNNMIDNPEIAQATDYWQFIEEVPGTCGKTISNPKISELTDIWRTASEI